MISSSTMRWLFLQNFIKTENWKDAQIKVLYNDVKRDRDDQQEQILIRKIFLELFVFPELNTNSEDLDTVSREIVIQSIVCQVKENNMYKFGKVTYRPKYVDSFKTQKGIIQKRIFVKEGETYNIEKIRETIRKLSRLGVFQEVDYQETILGDKINIEFILRENKTLSLQVEGGYGEFEGIQAGVRIFDHNIFGSTKSLGLRGKISEKSLLIEPVFDTPFFGRFRNEWVGFYERSDKDDFILERIGFETNLHRNIRKNIGLSFGYKFENTTAKDLVDELDKLKVGYVNFSGIQSSFSYINIDNLLVPHKGTFFKVKGEFNTKLFGSTFDFIKTESQVTQHFPISERITFSIGARFGFMKSLDSGVDIPIQTKFFSGGGNTIRGYEHNSIGPQVDGKSVGGEVRGIFNTELRFPLTRRTTKQFGVVFFDAGFLEESIDTIDSPEIYTSVGVGYRLLSPLGPIRLDLGLELKEKRKDDNNFNLEHDRFAIRNLYIEGYKARLHLSFGFAF
jgi:outer membrane protein insertion porin family